MLTAEFSGAEFSVSEFATDPRNYADIYCTAPLSFQGAGRCAVLVDIKGQAQLGVSAQPKTSAVNNFEAAANVQFNGLGAGGSFTNIVAGATSQFTSTGAVNTVVPVIGSASWTFNGLGVPQDGGVEGVSNWRWTAEARVESTAGANGFAQLGFAATPAVQTVIWTYGQTAEAKWLGRGYVLAVSNAVGAASLAFNATGKGGAYANAVGQDTMQWEATGRLRATWNAAGIGSLAFLATGNMDWSLTSSSTGFALWAMTASGSLAGVAGAVGEGRLTLLSDGRVAVVTPVVGQGGLGFAAIGKPGGELFASLPQSRARFNVQAKTPAFLVPQDTQLESV